MKVAFRADASSIIGTGHIMRCLVLAEAVRRSGGEATFVCRELPGHLCDMIAARGFHVRCLRADAAGAPRANAWAPPHGGLGTAWQTDAEQTLEALETERMIDWLVVDHYAIDARWESALRLLCRKLMVIDDLADRSHDCDLLLDQNLVAGMFDRYANKIPQHCELLVGPKYALLQRQYSELHRVARVRNGAVKRVLIYFGGGDFDNVTGMVLRAVHSLNRPDVFFDIVIGKDSQHRKAILQQVARHSNINLHMDLPSLAPLMAEADLAIGAGGTTSWERCCLGLPAVVITLADNQKALSDELARRGCIMLLGHKNEVSEVTLANVLGAIFDDGIHPDWSAKCLNLVDGEGVGRVFGIMALHPQPALVARLARPDDESLILRWANDTVVRQNSFVSAAIDADGHGLWFRKRISNTDRCNIYIIETVTGASVGQVRFELGGDAWEIDYSIDPLFRGRKLGKALLDAGIKGFRARNGRCNILGRVKATNIVSQKVFKALNFDFEDRGDEVVCRRLA